MRADCLNIKKMKRIGLLSGVVIAVFSACSKNSEDYQTINEPLEFEVPSNFPEPLYDMEGNPPTKMGFELGKKLFYDGRLSANGFISCGFCHEQKTAFTHHGHQFSHGIDDLEGTRNTPAIQNAAFMNEFTWDGATSHLDLFPIIPITNEVEMGETMSNVISKLQSDTEYQNLFMRAFDDGRVNNENFLKALSQFMLMMVSSNTKYDKFVRKESGGQLTNEELEGLAIFRAKCTSCHSSDLFTDGQFRNNGLPPNPKLMDVGREEVSGAESDRYKFKVPSLRNVELTAPYMHDGRFGSLMAVLDFYTDGITDSPTLDPIMKNNGKLGLDLSPSEKTSLISFLFTLTDETYIKDKRFSEY